MGEGGRGGESNEGEQRILYSSINMFKNFNSLFYIFIILLAHFFLV